MSEVVRASTQYGDLKGTIQVDGWDGLSALGLGIGCPKGYWPIGFTLYGESRRQGEGIEFDEIDVYTLAIDTSILDGKPGPDAIRAYANEHSQIPVFQFESKAKLSRLIPLLKRVSVVFQDRGTRGVPLVSADGDTIHWDRHEDELGDDDCEIDDEE